MKRKRTEETKHRKYTIKKHERKSLKKNITYNEMKRSRCDEIVLDGWMDG